MDFTILAVVLLLGVGVPIRNKLIRKYREEEKETGSQLGVNNDGYGKNRV